MSFKKGNLYTNEAKTEGIYPNTVYSAIYKDDMSKTLDADLGDLSHYNAQTITSGVDPLYLHLDMDLLWTNASPTSSFAPQTVSLDLSEYKTILITVKGYITEDNRITHIIIKGQNAQLSLTRDDFRYRDISTSDTTVIFGAGYLNQTLDNGRCIPLYIYGIR